MNGIQVFNSSEFGAIRTVVISGEPWFVGNDCARALGYQKPDQAIRTNVDKEDSCLQGVSDANNHIQQMKVINESGLYSLIFGSKLESARKFKKWVTSEVLPSIRKTGTYGQQRLPMTIPEQIQLIAQGHVELKAEIDSVKADLEQFKQDMPILGIEETKINNAVKRKGVECLGGKLSNAYNNKSVRGLLYSDLHKQLRREFGCSSYKAIKRNQMDTAIMIIEHYVPPLVLSQMIDAINAQSNLRDI